MISSENCIGIGQSSQHCGKMLGDVSVLPNKNQMFHGLIKLSANQITTRVTDNKSKPFTPMIKLLQAMQQEVTGEQMLIAGNKVLTTLIKKNAILFDSVKHLKRLIQWTNENQSTVKI